MPDRILLFEIICLKALERMRPYLCDKIIAERHFDYLRSRKILTREDTEEISSRSSSRKKTGKLLDYLAENPKGLDALIESIRRERTQNFLLQRITDVVLKVKNEKLEALKGLSCSTCMTSLYGGTNNLSRSYSDESNFFDKTKDKESTQIHHPEEDHSTAAFVSAVSLHSMNLPITEMGNAESAVFSATLPGPGDPGAPPLPPELQAEQQEPCSSSSENCFLPLRSRSVQPQ
ncbi:B-cell lymphoma/leukemia 10 isoform X2 [Neopsephotus bourkii]|uniref:B-cell lymphoma/leukemia 10 isoform X2 n=1 Tax=Neopsephotus bourkii TaxID=309878 RepID=UPI002AA5280A|nr:B-cell lymphoma/leukemia 10 isoform X2 [Neopsephotus bourkii]